MFKVALLLLSLLGGSASKAQNDFRLDHSKPYVYLKYDHVGPRKPLRQGEEPEGLWLRIVNNCRIPIAVRSFGITTGDPGVGVLYEVIPIGAPEISIQGNAGININDSQEKAEKSLPKGYSAELSSATRIEPGKDLLFSVPRSHVSQNWFIRVKFWLVLGPGQGPYSELDFFEDEVPH